jgi:hypothetical protein
MEIFICFLYSAKMQKIGEAQQNKIATLDKIGP